MPRQLDLSQTIGYLSGLKCSLSHSLQSAGDPWLWELEIYAPEKNGSISLTGNISCDYKNLRKEW